jgi:hypothetical protein
MHSKTWSLEGCEDSLMLRPVYHGEGLLYSLVTRLFILHRWFGHNYENQYDIRVIVGEVVSESRHHTMKAYRVGGDRSAFMLDVANE